MINDKNRVIGSMGNALVAAMANLSAATSAACSELSAYASNDDRDYGEGMNTVVVPALQRRAKAHRRKRNRRVH